MVNEEFQVIKSCLVIRMPKELDHHQSVRIREMAMNKLMGRRFHM